VITLEVDDEDAPGVKSREVNLVPKDTNAVRGVIASGPEEGGERGDAVVEGIGGFKIWMVVQRLIWIPQPCYSAISLNWRGKSVESHVRRAWS
jgi:hypothetical protein